MIPPERMKQIQEWFASNPTKVCSKCGAVKPYDEFAPNGAWCKDCKRAYDTAYNNANRQKKRDINARSYAKSSKGSHIHGARNRAQARGYEIVEDVDLEVVYKRDSGICQICGEAVDWSLDRRYDSMAASLDHTARIHSYATVQLAHRICNWRKGPLP